MCARFVRLVFREIAAVKHEAFRPNLHLRVDANADGRVPGARGGFAERSRDPS